MYSNLHISFGAVLLVMAGCHIARVTTDPHLLCAVFGSTLLSYNLHRYIGYQRMQSDVNDLPIRFELFGRYERLMYGLMGAALIVMLYGVYHLSMEYIIGLGMLGVGTLLYLLPVFSEGRRMRDYPFVKIGVIASVWAGLFCLPMLIANMPQMQLLIYYLHCFFFFIGLTLPFDIRDVVLDDLSDVRTIANSRPHGENVIIITLLYMMAIIMTLLMAYYDMIEYRLLIGIIIFLQIAWYLSIHRIKDRSELYFMGLLDGLILGYAAMWLWLS